MSRPLSTPGRRPYGNTAAERRAIARMVKLRRRGQTWQQIADALTASGTLARDGKPWRQGSVQRITLRALSADAG